MQGGFFRVFYLSFLGFWGVFVSLPVAANQELATRTRQDDIQDLVHHVLAMHRLAPKLVAELLRNQHRDGAVVQPRSSSLEVVVDEVLVGDRTKLLGAPRDGSGIEQLPSLLIRLEGDEELAHDPLTLALVVLQLSSREVAELAHRLALKVVVLLLAELELRLVVDIHRVLIERPLAEPGVGAGVAATIRRVAVHVERRCQHPRTLAAIAVAHLAADRHENLIVGQLRGNLDDHRAHLEAASRGVDVTKHLLVSRLRHTNDVVVIMRDIAPVDRRRVGQDASRDVVGVGDADAAVTIGDPEASLRHDGVGTIVSGESHVFVLGLSGRNGFGSGVRFLRECFRKFVESWCERITLLL